MNGSGCLGCAKAEAEAMEKVAFDIDAAAGLPVSEVRKRWPRIWWECEAGCGGRGVVYQDWDHYLYGDW